MQTEGTQQNNNTT